MRIGLDATPLLGARTGVGHYTARLLAAMVAENPGDDWVATAFTLRGRGGLPGVLPPGVRARALPLPARALREAWARTPFPPVEWLCGRVDVFHATNFVLPPLRRAAGVVTVHDLTFLRYPETVSQASLRYVDLVPRSIERAGVVCTPSNAVADEVRAAYRLDADRVVATPLGVDESWFDVRPPDEEARGRLGLPERYILAVGTLEPRKNLGHLIAAYTRLRADAPDTPPLVLVGAQGWGPALELGSLPEAAVVRTGYLDDDDLRRVVAGAACLAFPSLYEGFGLPPLEALACGVPVVATDLPVTRETLGTAATLTPPGDVDALAAGLAAAVGSDRDPAEVAKRRDHARQWSWQRCAATTMECYRRAAG